MRRRLGGRDVPGAFLDALISYPGRPNDRPLSDSTQVPGPDQIYSWFGRWVFPRSGLEVYGEFSKTEFPSSVRDFFISPGHTLGYTLGLQWAKRLGEREGPGVEDVPPGAPGEPASRPGMAAGGVIRLQAEHTFLERSSTFRQKPVGTYYTSRAVVQGYTNRGQVLGAAIGPGASSHWVAVDYVKEGWEAGIFGGRIRWENDALYSVRFPIPISVTGACTMYSLWAGVRGSVSGPMGTVSLSVSRGTRYNTHFRNYSVCGEKFEAEQAVDVPNTTLEVTWILPLGR
ncbi:MAG: hypothetical protein KatS3mg081_0005 [Gemmatimonadales bacterium]|nr:MAG: hypothetical protein KatS3mg081_0005 [Gemmatimonadales bacterium]